jgi:hypothetical protein
MKQSCFHGVWNGMKRGVKRGVKQVWNGAWNARLRRERRFETGCEHSCAISFCNHFPSFLTHSSELGSTHIHVYAQIDLKVHSAGPATVPRELAAKPFLLHSAAGSYPVCEQETRAERPQFFQSAVCVFYRFPNRFLYVFIILWSFGGGGCPHLVSPWHPQGHWSRCLAVAPVY